MKFAIILATMLTVSAAYTCRSIFRVNGHYLHGFNGYCDEGTLCTRLFGRGITEKHDLLNVEARGCFTCDDAYAYIQSDPVFVAAQIDNCNTCAGDYCNEDDHYYGK